MSDLSTIAEGLPRHLELLSEVSGLTGPVEAAVAKVRDAQFASLSDDTNTSLGLSLLELKNHLMLQYLSDLAYVQLVKVSGVKLEGDEAVDRLVTARTVLEKLRPLETKVKHQVDKALAAAEKGTVDESDPMHARANPKALLSKFGGSTDSENEEDDPEATEEEKKDGKYVAPKHIPAFYAERGDDKEDSSKKEKKKLISRSLIDDLRRQHMDTPEEIHEHEDVLKKRKIEAMKERTDYEERNFMRLPLTKKQKHSRRQMSTIGTIADEVTSFGRSYFSTEAEGGKKRKRKSGGANKKKKKFHR